MRPENSGFGRRGIVHCAPCATLNGQPATTPPPVPLRGGAVFVTLEGVRERYRCTICESTWERVRPNRQPDAAPRMWHMVKVAPPQPVPPARPLGARSRTTASPTVA